MNTTANLSPQKEQDDFTLSFLHWLGGNFKQTGNDAYCLLEDADKPFPEVTLFTTAQCLEQYRKQCIPPLPSLATDSEHKLLSLARDAIRKNSIMFIGYQKIHALLLKEGDVEKEAIKGIIIDTMTQTTSPS